MICSDAYQTPLITIDVGKEIEKKEFTILKGVLCFHSPVFEAIFEGNFRERNKRKLKLPMRKSTHS